MQAADFLLVHSTGFIPGMIHAGEWIHHAGPDTYWTHAAFIETDAGDTIEAQAHGIVRGHVKDHPDSLVVDSKLLLPDRLQAIEFARSCLGRHYGYLTIASIAADLATPKALILRSPNTLICSEFVARCLEHGGWICPDLETNRAMPSDLSRWFRQ